MKKLIAPILIVVLVCVSLTGCTVFFSSGTKIGYSGSQIGTHMSASFSTLNGNEGAKIPLKAGDRITITYTLTADSGTLTLTFEDKDGSALYTAAAPDSGSQQIDVAAAQTYTLRITGAQAKGSYDVKWTVDKTGESGT